MPLPLSVSILTGETTFHFPSGIFWKEPHGALSVSACPTSGARTMSAETAEPKLSLIMMALALRLSPLLER